MLVVAASGFTIADYLFKSTAAAEISAGDLGSFFATTYLVINGLSLVAQILLVNLVIRRVNVTAALAVVPVLLDLGGIGVLLMHMIGSSSESVQDLTAYHIGELRLGRFHEPLAAIVRGGANRPDLLRTISLLSDEHFEESSRAG